MDEFNILYGIAMISSGLCCIPFIIAVINFRRINLNLKPIFLLLVITIISETLNIVFVELGLHNQDIFHYFTVLEFALISLFYSFFFKHYFNPLLINLIIPIFLIGAYIDSRINGLNSVNNFSAAIESVILIFYSLFLFYYVLKNLIFENLLTTPIFWLNTAVLFYFSGNMILFVFSSHVASDDWAKYRILWIVIHTFFNVLYNVFLSIGFWKTRVK